MFSAVNHAILHAPPGADSVDAVGNTGNVWNFPNEAARTHHAQNPATV